MPQTIESDDKTIGEVFSDFYLVPNYQREYVWTERQVERLLEDVSNEFDPHARRQDSEYFIGSIVVCPSNSVLELIDGQQRLTTLFLILCTIRSLLEEMGEQPPSLLQQQISSADLDETGHETHRLRIELQYRDSQDVLGLIANKDGSRLERLNPSRTIENLKTARTLIEEFLRGQYANDTDTLRRFYAFLTQKVKLIRITTSSRAHALKVFETINDRGVGLDAMDLLKNLMFMKASEADFEDLKVRWQKLVNILYQSGEKPLRFLRYFIFAAYDEDRLREEQIYDWFVSHSQLCGYERDPLGFVDTLVEAGEAYGHFLSGMNSRGKPNRYLENIRLLSGASRQHFMLLLAGRHLDEEGFDTLARQLENLLFTYFITRESAREFERKFAQWAPQVRNLKTTADVASFVAMAFKPEQKRLAGRFELALSELREGDLQRYRLRYVLAKLTQHVNEAAYGSRAECDLNSFVSKNIEIEHILSQQPTTEDVARFNRPDEYYDWVPKLGNLALLEKSINASIGRETFFRKKQEYSKSKFLLTKVLGGPVQVGIDTAINRAVSALRSYEKWDSETIGDRQRLLANLAYEVWDVPRSSAPQVEMTS